MLSEKNAICEFNLIYKPRTNIHRHTLKKREKREKNYSNEVNVLLECKLWGTRGCRQSHKWEDILHHFLTPAPALRDKRLSTVTEMRGYTSSFFNSSTSSEGQEVVEMRVYSSFFNSSTSSEGQEVVEMRVYSSFLNSSTSSEGQEVVEMRVYSSLLNSSNSSEGQGVVDSHWNESIFITS